MLFSATAWRQSTKKTLCIPLYFVFYTDGLIDIGRPGAEERLARLARLVESQAKEQCEELADAIISDQITPDGTDDDVALLVVEWAGSGAV